MFPVDPLPILGIDAHMSTEMDLIFSGIRNKAPDCLPNTGYIRPGEYLPAIANNKFCIAKAFPMIWGYYEEKNGVGKHIPFVSLKRIQEEQIFQNGYVKRRCVVAVNCFYIKSRGVYYRVRHAADEKLLLAAVFRTVGKERETAYTTIALVDTPLCYAQYGDRIPLVVPRDRCFKWIQIGGRHRFRYILSEWNEPLIFEKVEDPSVILQQIKRT